MQRTAIFLCVFFLITAQVCTAETNGSSADFLKAEFICNFAKFVHWPQEKPKTPLKICILGENPIASALTELKEDKVQVCELNLSECKNADSCIEKIKQNHILYVSPSGKQLFSQILPAIRNSPVLTIGDTPGFSEMGGAINMAHIGEQLRFEINTEAATTSGLTISSQLLKLAILVNKTSKKASDRHY